MFGLYCDIMFCLKKLMLLYNMSLQICIYILFFLILCVSVCSKKTILCVHDYLVLCNYIP